MPKVLAIVQARLGSSRLPGKVLLEVGGTPMIDFLLSRLSQSKRVDEIVVASPDTPGDQALVDHVRALGFGCAVGSENDVLDRFMTASLGRDADILVRITGDCPLVDPGIVDLTIERFLEADVDYLSNTVDPTYPDGLDVEVFSADAFARAHRESTTTHDREHVTPYLKDGTRYRVGRLQNDEDLSGLRWTVDEPDDLRVIDRVVQHFAPRTDFQWREVLNLFRDQPEIFAANQDIRRNEGSDMSSGQKLWRRAKKVIPGGNMFLSKRAEMYLPDFWPTYYSRAKGCRVWDLDDVEYIDMSLMGIGTNSLGYGHPKVDAAAAGAIAASNMSTLNCPEEVRLAERLVELHPWADMVRLARTGGEANSIAIRIARASVGREAVAFCGYHGWHDWYLSANLESTEHLASHLLPGLDPNGVPSSLSGTVHAFEYNNFESLEALVKRENIGVIKMEVSRSSAPLPGFLESVRRLATEKGIVLIFDECTSGFRQTFGGVHKQYGVEPDMAVFGKALGNGFAITAVIGRREIMEAAQTSFISSTFWSERVGPSAALATLDAMEECRSWERLAATGTVIQSRWAKLAEAHGLEITIGGLPALSSFSFASESALEYKTLITQEMLKRGYLASTALYVCTEHTEEIVDRYFEELDPIFATIAECEKGRDVTELLDGPVCHSGFKRLT